MAKVYISSTFSDLQECRREVLVTLRRMGHEAVAMEDYVAADERPVEQRLRDVAVSDLYIGIFAWHYGWIPSENNPDQLSITEMEYREAVRVGKPCLIFLLHEDAPWPRKFIDRDAERIERLRRELSDKHLSAFFASANDIGSVVGPAVYQWAKDHGHTSPGVLIPEFDLEAYYAALRKRYQRIDLEGLTPPQRDEYLQLQLRSIFVEQSVRENSPPVELSKDVREKLRREREIDADDSPASTKLDDSSRAREVYYENPVRSVLDVLTDSHHQRVAILGDPGSGKSTLSRYVLLSLIDPAGDEKIRRAFEGYLPLLVELRSYAGLNADNKCDTFLEFFEYMGKSEGWHLTADALHAHLKNAGRVIVIFDGLDEIFDPALREQVVRRIVDFAADYPKARIIVTSRIIGYQREALANADFSHFTLQELDESQVATFVSRWYELALSDRPDEARDRRERILRAFQDHAAIRQLASNPMLLTIMAIIGKHQELPRERWKLYEHAADVLIEHWDVNRHLKDQRLRLDFIDEEEKKEMLRRLAFQMQSGTGGLAGNYIHRDELQSVFENYLNERPALSPLNLTRIASEIINQLRERNFILALFGANLYGFVHRAFLEYFSASAFVNKFEKTQEMTLEQLKEDVYDAHWEDQSWHEVLRLICGMIDERFAGEIIDCLMNQPNQPQFEDYDTRPPWNIALAVQCLGELRNPGTVAEPAGELLKMLCSVCEYFIDKGYSAYTSNVAGFLQAQILAFAGTIGSNWPQRSQLAEWLQEIGLLDIDNSWLYAEPFGEFVGSLGAGLSEIHKAILDYADDSDPELRALSPFALARGWSTDPRTLLLLRDRAAGDASYYVRRVALTALAQYYRDDIQTLPLLRDRAVNDPHAWVHRAALTALAQYYRDDAETLPLLRDCAVNDADEGVRRVALMALAQYYRDNADTLPLLYLRAYRDPSEDVRGDAYAALAQYYRDAAGTLLLLRERAANDEDENARGDALTALAQYYRDDAETLPLLRDRAANDEDENARSDALMALAQYFHDDARTLPLLRDRAVNDTDEWVRRAALTALAQYFRDDDKTLPLLHDLVVRDVEGGVRGDALTALAQYYRDDGHTLPLLRDRVINDVDARVRSVALNALAQHYRDDAETLPLLRDHAVNDLDEDVRSTVLVALAQRFSNDARTLPLLHNRAVNDADGGVRRIALTALVRHYSAETELLLRLLRDRVINDADEWVRRAAFIALVRHFHHDPLTLLLVQELAQGMHNTSQYIRTQAMQKLARGWPDDPSTLLLIDSMTSESEPAFIRQIAISVRHNIRRHRSTSWTNWLKGITEENRFTQLPSCGDGFPVILACTMRLQNIKAFADAEIPLRAADAKGARPLTLILGDNAAGKSTLLRCLALASLGPEMANQVEKRPDSYLRHGAERGWIEVRFQLKLDPASEPNDLGEFCIGLEIRKGESSFRAMEDKDLKFCHRNAADRVNWLRRQTRDTFGFVCGYGALRSLSDDPSALMPEEPKEVIERAVSLFRSGSPLMDPDVLGKMLSGDLSNFRTAPTEPLPADVPQAMRDNLLKLLPDVGEINPGQSPTVTLNGIPVPIRNLSDGYGSLLALIGHLYRHALSAMGWKGDPTQVFGLAIIDEIDLHLHPAWQRRVLLDLRNVFPNLQIIASSHSAMVAGSVPTDAILVLRKEQEQITVIPDLPSVEGWRADQILTSLLFDLPTTRGVQTEDLFSRYAKLLNERGPQDEEVRELGKQVSQAMGMEGEGVVDQHTHELLDELMRKRFEALDEEIRNQVLAKAELMLSGGKERA